MNFNCQEKTSTEHFFCEYNRTFWLWSLLSLLGYNDVTKRLSLYSATIFSTRKQSIDHVADQMQTYLGLSHEASFEQAHLWYKNFSDSGLLVFFFKKMNRVWWEKRTVISKEQYQLLKTMKDHGGILLSYHSHHYHIALGNLVGNMGCTFYGISAAKNPEFDHPSIRKYHIHQMHDGSEVNFSGGKFIYYYGNNNISILKEIKKHLNSSNIIGSSSADFPINDKKIGYYCCTFLGKKIKVQSLFFDLAHKHQVPLYTGLLLSTPNQHKDFELVLESIKGETAEVSCQNYITLLEKQLRLHPYAWQGWEWINALLLAD